jgi:hypothetical protein
MTNDRNPEKADAPKAKAFVPSQTAGASDNAEGVGARLHPFPFPFPFPLQGLI